MSNNKLNKILMATTVLSLIIGPSSDAFATDGKEVSKSTARKKASRDKEAAHLASDSAQMGVGDLGELRQVISNLGPDSFQGKVLSGVADAITEEQAKEVLRNFKTISSQLSAAHNKMRGDNNEFYKEVTDDEAVDAVVKAIKEDNSNLSSPNSLNILRSIRAVVVERKKAKLAAATNIQRAFRGFVARGKFAKLKAEQPAGPLSPDRLEESKGDDTSSDSLMDNLRAGRDNNSQDEKSPAASLPLESSSLDPVQLWGSNPPVPSGNNKNTGDCDIGEEELDVLSMKEIEASQEYNSYGSDSGKKNALGVANLRSDNRRPPAPVRDVALMGLSHDQIIRALTAETNEIIQLGQTPSMNHPKVFQCVRFFLNVAEDSGVANWYKGFLGLDENVELSEEVILGALYKKIERSLLKESITSSDEGMNLNQSLRFLDSNRPMVISGGQGDITPEAAFSKILGFTTDLQVRVFEPDLLKNSEFIKDIKAINSNGKTCRAFRGTFGLREGELVSPEVAFNAINATIKKRNYQAVRDMCYGKGGLLEELSKKYGKKVVLSIKEFNGMVADEVLGARASEMLPEMSSVFLGQKMEYLRSILEAQLQTEQLKENQRRMPLASDRDTTVKEESAGARNSGNNPKKPVLGTNYRDPKLSPADKRFFPEYNDTETRTLDLKSITSQRKGPRFEEEVRRARTKLTPKENQELDKKFGPRAGRAHLVNGVNTIRAVSQGVHNALGSISTSVGNRLLVSAGDDSRIGGNVWVKGFVGSAAQKGEDSFKTQHDGFTVGADMEVLDDTLVLGLAYTKADLKSKVKGGDDTLKADANIGSIYGRYMITDSIYTTAIASVGDVKVKVPNSKKKISGKAFKGEVNLAAIMNFDNGIFVSPKVGVSYQQVKAPDVKDSSVKFSLGEKSKVVGSASVSLGVNHTMGDVTLTPEVHAGISQTLSGGKNKTSISQFDGKDWNKMDTSALDSKDKSKTTYNLGTSLKVAGSAAVSMDLGYDCGLRKKYKAHTGFVKLSLKF